MNGEFFWKIEATEEESIILSLCSTSKQSIPEPKVGKNAPKMLYDVSAREVMEAFPDAKVILTVRDPTSWYKSVKETIYKGHIDSDSFPVNIWGRLTGMTNFFNMKINLSRKHKNRLKQGTFKGMIIYFIKMYLKHIQAKH